jgi:hypothetical protein
MLQFLYGQWHLSYSNFSMWRSAKIANVSFNYTPAQSDGVIYLLDEVRYLDGGKSKSIKGVDFMDEDDPRKFIWRGKGWMFWIKSTWQVEWMNETNTCVVLSFKKTLLSKGGVDIISKEKFPEAETLNAALAAINGDKILQEKAQNLFRVLQQ